VKAQLWTWNKEQMTDYTKAWTGERFPDGRPKVPDEWLDRAKDTSAEEITIPSGGRGGGSGTYSQYEGDFRVLHPQIKMAGRAFTVMFMPTPPRSRFDHYSKSARARYPNPQQPICDRHATAG